MSSLRLDLVKVASYVVEDMRRCTAKCQAEGAQVEAVSCMLHTCSIVPQECCHLIDPQGQRQVLHSHMLPIDLQQARLCFKA